MSLCVHCGYPTLGPADLCAHHSAGDVDDWAAGNRLMCDFLHRGIVSPRAERRAATMTIFTRLEPGRAWDP